jgi:hypothetical protein
MIVAPLLVLSGAVIALALAVAAPARRHTMHRGLLAPAAPPAGLCTHADRADRDACWEALFERMSQPAPLASPRR